MSELDDELDDPGLRVAVRRAMGRESAPPALQHRIEGLLATAGAAGNGAAAEESAAPRSSRFRIAPRIAPGAPWKLVAAAAMVLLAVGYMVMEIRSEFFPPRPPMRVASVASFPATFAQELVQAHDNCGKLADHHLVKGDDPKAVAAKLSAEEGIAVFADAIGDGWTFRGAGMCTIGQKKAAHLMFVRGGGGAAGGESVSIFSLSPPSACTAGGGTSFEQELDRHALVGFVHEQTFYAIVGTKTGGEMTPAQLQPVVTMVRKCQGAGQCTGGRGVQSAVAMAR
jgi:hypothetical protein